LQLARPPGKQIQQPRHHENRKLQTDRTSRDNDVQVKLIEKLVKDSLLNLVTNKNILIREGFHLYNLKN
jgi:hypothetical protein